MNNVDLGRRCRFRFPDAVGGLNVLAETDENGMAQGMFVGPIAEFDAGDEGG